MADDYSPGLDLAATYIQNHLREWGVKPAGDASRHFEFLGQAAHFVSFNFEFRSSVDDLLGPALELAADAAARVHFIRSIPCSWSLMRGMRLSPVRETMTSSSHSILPASRLASRVRGGFRLKFQAILAIVRRQFVRGGSPDYLPSPLIQASLQRCQQFGKSRANTILGVRGVHGLMRFMVSETTRPEGDFISESGIGV